MGLYDDVFPAGVECDTGVRVVNGLSGRTNEDRIVMSRLLSLGVAWCVLLSSARAEVIEMRFTGTLSPRRSTLKAPEKQFTLYCLVDRKTATADYVIEEQGPGRWSWPERYGRVGLVGAAKPGIRVLYDHDGSLYPQVLQRPVFEYPEKLRPGTSWMVDRTKYTVAGSQSKKSRQCWRVELTNRFGRSGSVWVEKSTGLVVAASRRIVMGQGDEFVLDTELVSQKPVDAKRLASLNKPWTTLLGIQKDLKRKPNSTRSELSAAQLGGVRAKIARLTGEARSTPFASLVAVISKDISGQSKRAASVGELAKQKIGKPAPRFKLTTIDRKTIDSKSLAGKIVVLHFWSYKGDQLVEPYGQVGYLDFLYGKRRRLGVEVIGVAVNPSFENPRTKRAALRSVKKLREFMNLGYPVATDSGKVIELFGDPRQLDAKLPLWVVIGADGKVAGYDVGFYRIKVDEGLKQLDELVIELIRAKRKKK
jgi:peroxiredoxin